MALVTFSPLIASMSGKTADAVFASWKGRNYVRQHIIPANPQTAGQTAVRNSLAEAVALWQSVSETLKTAYGDGADALNISGYNDMVGRSRAAIQAVSGLYGPRRNNDAADPRLAIPTDLAYDSEPVAGSAKFDWTDPGQGAGYYMGYLAYDSTANRFLAEDLATVLTSVETITIAGLTIASVYLFTFFINRDADNAMVHCTSCAHTQAS